eukprot:scaffold15084_cov21-Tisochrysis_lutea.AAC.5
MAGDVAEVEECRGSECSKNGWALFKGHEGQGKLSSTAGPNMPHWLASSSFLAKPHSWGLSP